jgi:heme exporter protein D
MRKYSLRMLKMLSSAVLLSMFLYTNFLTEVLNSACVTLLGMMLALQPWGLERLGLYVWEGNGLTAATYITAINEGIATRKGILCFRCTLQRKEAQLQSNWQSSHMVQTAQSKTIRAANTVRIVAVLFDALLRMR